MIVSTSLWIIDCRQEYVTDLIRLYTQKNSVGLHANWFPLKKSTKAWSSKTRFRFIYLISTLLHFEYSAHLTLILLLSGQDDFAPGFLAISPLLRGQGGVPKHQRATWTIFAAQVCYVDHSQPCSSHNSLRGQGDPLGSTGISHSDTSLSP